MRNFAQKVVRGSAGMSVNFFARVAVSFMLTPFIVHSLGDRMYGFWSLVGAIIGYYGLLDLGLSTAVSRYISGALGARNEKDLNNIVSTSFVLFSLVGLLVILVTIVIVVSIPFINLNVASDDITLFGKVILILGLDTAVAFPIRLFRGILASQLRYDIMSGLALLSLLLRTPLIVMVLISGHSVLAMAIVTVLSKMPEYVLTIFLARKNLPGVSLSRRGWNRTTARTLFSFASYAFISQIANILRFQIDVVVISAFMGLAAVAHYRIGSLIATLFLNFMIGSISMLTPVFSRLEGAQASEGIMNTLFFSTKISVCISTFMGFGLIFWGKPFIELWMGPDYLDAYPVLFILALGFVLLLWQSPAAALLVGITRHKFLALLNTAEGVSNLLLSIVLVRHYGLIGVALGTFIPLVISKLFIQPVYVCRVLSVPYLQYMVRIVKTLTVVCLALVLPGLCSLRFAAPDITVLLILGFASFSFFSLVIWFCELNSSETRMLRKAISLRRVR